jgi:hypothetical protein
VTTLTRMQRLDTALLQLDELIVLIMGEEECVERELWLAHCQAVRQQLSFLIREEMATAVEPDELKGYDC